MTPVDRLRAIGRHNPLVPDALLAAVLLVPVLFAPSGDSSGVHRASGLTVVIGVATCAALALRRRSPIPVLAVSLAGTAAISILVHGRTPLAAVAMVALYTVAVSTNRRTAWIAWGATAATLAVVSASTSSPSVLDPNVLSYLPWTAVAAAAGDGLRNRRAYVAAIEERAVRAEQTRQQEARRQVAEERLRIARELHDVIAHRIAVVNVQAGVASHLIATQPDAALEALAHVRQAGRAVLEELSDILNVLRQPGEPVDPTAPAPGLGQLEPLVASFAAAGLVVDWSLSGRPREVGPAVDLVAYRVLEEALTNAHKHGTGTAALTVAYSESSLALTVVNPIGAAGRPGSPGEVGSGHGLVGMRERAVAVGGVLHAATEGGAQFRVSAVLPLQTVAVS